MSFVVQASLQVLLLLALACGPSDPLQEIRELQSTGSFDETIVLLRKIVDEDPSQTEAWLLLGKALLTTGDAELAVRPLRKAAEAREHAVEAGLHLARAMLESRRALDAVEEVERVLEIEPENLEAAALLEDAHQSTRRVEESLANIDRVLELEPTNLAVLVTRVMKLIALDRIEEAGASLDAARMSFDASGSDAPRRALARLCVASALLSAENGRTETAAERYADCAERFPTEEVAVMEIVAFYDRVGDFERSTQILERAAKKSKADVFHTTLARRMDALGLMEAEERRLHEKAATGRSTKEWFAVADYYVQRDRFDKAIDAFEIALSLSPGSPRLSFAYADTLVQAERFTKAREVASQLEQPELQSLIRGRILLAEGDAQGALAAFEAGIQLWPENAVARFMAGQAAEGVGDFDAAVSHYRESFGSDPSASTAGLALAELYSARGSYARALRVSRSYLRTSPRQDDPMALLSSIRIAHALDQSEIVEEGLERLGKMYGQAAVAQRASFMADAGDTEQAVRVVEVADLDLTDSSNSTVLRILIEQLGLLGQHEKATGLVEVALAAYPDESVFHELHGRASYTAARPDSARASYERALALDPKSWRALEGLAVLAAASGDPNRALRLYDRAITADPDDATAALAAVVLVRETDPDEAARRLERLLDAYPRNASAANALAEILVDRGELEHANAYASRAAWFHLPAARGTIERITKLRGGASAAPQSAAGSL